MWPFPDPRIAAREFSRFVVRLPNWLGDQVMATPALDAIRARYPGAHIAAHGGPGARMLFEGGSWFDEFLVAGRRDPAGAQAALLRAGRFEACLLLTGSLRTALPPFLARIPHRIGYRRSGRTPLLTAHWPRPRPGGGKAPYPTQRYYLDLVARLGARGGGRIHLPLTDRARGKADAWLDQQGIAPEAPLLLLCVGATFGASKLWPAAYFAQVADEMQRRCGVRAILLCGPGEEAIGAAVSARARLPLVDTGSDPLSIEVLKALIARARVLLTNDTGPRHIASAFRVPVVCVMGPTDPAYTETVPGAQIVLRAKDVACAPCHFKICPIDHRCMRRISPERVLEELERAWKSPPDPAA